MPERLTGLARDHRRRPSSRDNRDTERQASMYSRILVPIDGTEIGQQGLELACVFADHHNSKLILGMCHGDGHSRGDCRGGH